MRFYQKLAQLGYTSYEAYLASPHWKQFKDNYQQSNRRKTCVVCSSRKVQLHHCTYQRLGNEDLKDVLPLCGEHHTAVHLWLKAKRWPVEKTVKAVAALCFVSVDRVIPAKKVRSGKKRKRLEKRRAELAERRERKRLEFERLDAIRKQQRAEHLRKVKIRNESQLRAKTAAMADPIAAAVARVHSGEKLVDVKQSTPAVAVLKTVEREPVETNKRKLPRFFRRRDKGYVQSLLRKRLAASS